ncbi:MAG: SIS domain-containing protein [Albidovulum sp.]|nr:SIS domain-containing protein [Albidovulum sp.]
MGSEDELQTPLLGKDSPLDRRAKRRIRDLYDQEQQIAIPTNDALDPERRRRVDLTITEIQGQSAAIQKTLEEERRTVCDIARKISGTPVRQIYLVGCGDSLSAMFGARALYEQLLGIKCEPMQALDFAYYFNRPLDRRTLVVGLSSSGTTTRTVEAILLAKALGAKTLALTNTPESPLMQESDHGLLVHAERKGWPTQASTAALALLFQFAIEFAASASAKTREIQSLQIALDEIPALVDDVTKKCSECIRRIARIEARKHLYLFSGGGASYSAAFFGAAKIKECTPNHAIAIPLEEFHHYNSQKDGDPLFLTAPSGPTIPRARDTAAEGKRRGGNVYSVTSEDEELLANSSDEAIALPRMLETLTPLVYAVPAQLFAYYVGKEKFRIADAERAAN